MQTRSQSRLHRSERNTPSAYRHPIVKSLLYENMEECRPTKLRKLKQEDDEQGLTQYGLPCADETQSDPQPKEEPIMEKDHDFPSLLVNKARQTDPDTYSWDEAMDSEHKEKFLKAAQVEIDQLTTMGTWEEDHKSNTVTRIFPTQWVFKIKRTSDVTLTGSSAACSRLVGSAVRP